MGNFTKQTNNKKIEQNDIQKRRNNKPQRTA